MVFDFSQTIHFWEEMIEEIENKLNQLFLLDTEEDVASLVEEIQKDINDKLIKGSFYCQLGKITLMVSGEIPLNNKKIVENYLRIVEMCCEEELDAANKSDEIQQIGELLKFMKYITCQACENIEKDTESCNEEARAELIEYLKDYKIIMESLIRNSNKVYDILLGDPIFKQNLMNGENVDPSSENQGVVIAVALPNYTADDKKIN